MNYNIVLVSKMQFIIVIQRYGGVCVCVCASVVFLHLDFVHPFYLKQSSYLVYIAGNFRGKIFCISAILIHYNVHTQ